MRDYSIRLNGDRMTILDADGSIRAQYRLTPGSERAEIAAMRRAIDRHLRRPGATMGNYQW